MWIQEDRPMEQQPWLMLIRDKYGGKTCCRIIGCKPVMLGGYINGSYVIPERMLSSMLYLCLCYLSGKTRTQLTEDLWDMEIDRHIPEKERKERAGIRRKVDKWNKANPDRVVAHGGKGSTIKKRPKTIGERLLKSQDSDQPTAESTPDS